MAVTQVTTTTPAVTIFKDTVLGATASAVKASSAVVYYISVDNSGNGAAASYVKLWNTASGSVVVGTTAPDEVIYAPAGAVVTQFFYTSSALGKTFGTALTAACVTTAGTAGVTPPTNPVIVSVAYA